MLVLRCTRKLLARLPVTPAAPGPTSTTLLGDWYANPISLGGARLVLCVSERTLLPVVVPAKDLRSLGARLADAAGEVLRALGVKDALVRAEQDQMSKVAFSPTRSRAVLGSMNDFRWLLDAHLAPGRSLIDVSVALSHTPCTPIDDFPDRATVSLFAECSFP